MRYPNVLFARPGRPGAAEPIEFAGRRAAEAELGDWHQFPDPRKGPAKQMSSESFLVWLCGRHDNLERNILVDGFLLALRGSIDGRTTLFLKTAEPPALRVDLRMGRIPPANLKTLTRHARSRTLRIEAVEDVPTRVRGAACFVGSEVVGVLAARDMMVLER